LYTEKSIVIEDDEDEDVTYNEPKTYNFKKTPRLLDDDSESESSHASIDELLN